MDVRKSNIADLLGIEALLGRSYPVLMAPAYAADVLVLALPVMTRANPDLIKSGTFYVAEDAGTIVGCGGWTFAEPGSGIVVAGLAHIRHFAVDPERTGEGIGRAIYELSEREAVKGGAVRIQAFSSLNAEAFYKRMGLKRVSLSPVTMRDGGEFPAVLMQGSLPGPG